MHNLDKIDLGESFQIAQNNFREVTALNFSKENFFFNIIANLLSKEIANAPKVNSFKKKLDCWMNGNQPHCL